MAVGDDLARWTDEERSTAAERLATFDGVLSATRRRIDAAQLVRTLRHAPHDEDSEAPRLRALDLSGSVVEGDLTLTGAAMQSLLLEDGAVTGDFHAERCRFQNVGADRATFSGKVSLEGATVDAAGSFAGARFERSANFQKLVAPEAELVFDDARFLDDVRFDHCAIRELSLPGARVDGALVVISGRLDSTWLYRAQIGGSCAFEHTEFRKNANFGGLAVDGDVEMRDVRFTCPALMATVRFEGRADFRSAVFGEPVDLRQAKIGGDADLSEAVFARADHIGPLAVGGKLVLRAANFERAVDVEVATDRVSLERARFHAGANLLVSLAVVDAEYASFGGPSLIADSLGASPPVPYIAALAELGNRARRVRVESLRSADVGKLTLSNVDLTGCRFFGAHNLDKLRIDANSTFAPAPRRHARRRALAEEFDWREARGRKEWSDWRTEPLERRRPEAIEAGQIASLYRDLRRGQEERSDEPGAADFYYGEMEMRRHGASGVERMLLTLYWLVSGYGLRASRAFAALLLTIALFTVGFRYAGFEPEASWTRAALFSAESTSGLFRVPATPGLEPTEVGEVLQIVLRLLGPLFFGLMLLSIRGRVKR
jgi:uncharacterized protein YjbI with pentapeptide repeats